MKHIGGKLPDLSVKQQIHDAISETSEDEESNAEEGEEEQSEFESDSM